MKPILLREDKILKVKIVVYKDRPYKEKTLFYPVDKLINLINKFEERRTRR